MSINYRSYGGQYFRPKPTVEYDPQFELCLIATPWGNPSSLSDALQIIKDYCTSSKNGIEATTPFEHITCLSPLANRLRVAAQLANNYLLNQSNQSEYITGVELTLISKDKFEIAILQVGQPQVFLKRENLDLQPLIASTSPRYLSEHSPSPPLPDEMLGIHNKVNWTIKTFRSQPNDKILLLSHSFIPREIYSLSENQFDLNQISWTLTKNNPEHPFWLGLLEVS